MTLGDNLGLADAGFKLRPVAGNIGAEIIGVTAGGDMSEETVAALRSAWLKHKVLFFRKQDHLTLASQEAFAKRFGALAPHPTIPKIAGTEMALSIAYADGSTAANEWHSDETFQDAYPMAGILRAMTLPTTGGDTIWANTVTAYERLPEALKRLAGELWALHANTSPYNSARRHPNPISTIFETEHPLVRVHPETGERALVLGFHVQHLVGLSRQDSARLINIFQDHITKPDNTVRWTWALGDLVLWDNRATQHYGVGDFNERRELHRVALDGDVPVSIDGRHSILRRQEEWRIH